MKGVKESYCPPSLRLFSGLDRWRAGSRKWVTQRFKKDSLIKYRNFTKVPKFEHQWVPFEGKNCQNDNSDVFLASISLHFNWSFCTLALNLNEYCCQIQFSYSETFQMSYWRSKLNNLDDFWPITSILNFETWIFLRLLKTLLAKMSYHWLLYSTINIYQDNSGSLYH